MFKNLTTENDNLLILSFKTFIEYIPQYLFTNFLMNLIYNPQNSVHLPLCFSNVRVKIAKILE